jgi:gluconate 2-dehydrogenase gamma chain
MTEISRMDRRELLQRAMLLVGAALSPLGSDALAAAKTELDRTRLALLSAVVDTLIPKTDTPGAVEAGVPQHFEALLHQWASPTRRAELIAALDAIDELAQQKQRRSFASLTPNERHELLAAYDAAALQRAASGPGARFVDPAYAKMKELIVVLFYVSETALTHELTYEHTPGEWRPSVPVTPATRAVGGVGLI